jgi:hypothetical protein
MSVRAAQVCVGSCGLAPHRFARVCVGLRRSALFRAVSYGMLSVTPCRPDMLFSALRRTLPLCRNAVMLMPSHALPL